MQLECPRELLQLADDGDYADGLPTHMMRCSRASSILTHLQIASSDPTWRAPPWQGAAIRLACIVLRGGPAVEMQGAWNQLIGEGASWRYVSRVLASLEEI